jgi:heat shock protein HslJ
MIRIAAVLMCATAFSAAAIAEDRPLMCFGNEPSWSVDLTEPGLARFATPDGEAALYRGAAIRRDELGETLWRGSPAKGRDLVAWLRDSACSDNMSDTEHPVTARVSLPDGRFLAGCCRLVVPTAGPAAATEQTEQTASPLEGPTWRLAQISGAGPAGLASLTRPVTVQFEGGQARGFSGCNNFSGGYQRKGDRLQLGQLASTMMACPEPAMAVENAFQAAFAGTLQYTVDGDRLTLSAASGGSLSFTREAPPQLDGSSWEVTGYNNNRQAVVGVIGDPAITLTFGAEEVSGSAGCNRFWASYTTDGDSISFGPTATTRMACDEPLMTQEREFLAALASAVTWRIDGNVLDMHRADSERAIWAVSQ